MTRRSLLSGLAVAGAAAESARAVQSAPLKGRLKQGATMGCFGKLRSDPEAVGQLASRLGLKGIDLVGPNSYAMLKKFGLLPTMIYGTNSIPNGVNRTEYHDVCEKQVRDGIAQAAAAGGPNVIVLAGDRHGHDGRGGYRQLRAFLEQHQKRRPRTRTSRCAWSCSTAR